MLNRFDTSQKQQQEACLVLADTCHILHSRDILTLSDDFSRRNEEEELLLLRRRCRPLICSSAAVCAACKRKGSSTVAATARKERYICTIANFSMLCYCFDNVVRVATYLAYLSL